MSDLYLQNEWINNWFRVINTLTKNTATTKEEPHERIRNEKQPAEFEAHFTKTRESIRFTFNGWDGKSYDGESRNAKVYRTNLPGFEEVKLIKVGKGLHYIDEERQITEKATGEKHPEAGWLVDVERA